MANLTGSISDDNVVQVETTDTWLGGPGQKANQQAQALLNKILWTRDQMISNWKGAAIVFTNSGSNVWANKYPGTHNQAHYRLDKKQVWMSGIITNTSGSSPATSDIMTLPTEARPANDTFVMVWGGLPVEAPILVKIGSDGKVTSATGISGDVYLDGVSYKIGADTY